jgi:multidrug transporter EmrE-like cation transporter
MAWMTILAAGLFETGFAVSLKLSHGMTGCGRPSPSPSARC